MQAFLHCKPVVLNRFWFMDHL